MRKLEVQKKVLKDGKPLNLDLFTWCERTNTFSSGLGGLAIDFSGVDYCTFKTGSDCTFKTGWDCTFKTGSDCTFKTGSGCTFDTDSDCTFKTGSDCTFKTGWDCTFDTDSDCTFDTDSDCTFDTDSDCVVVRRDVFEIIKPEENKTIKLNSYGSPGFVYLDEKKVTIELTQE